MDLFKRMGTDRHKFKVEFFLKTLECKAKLRGDVYVKIKRSDHKVTSEKKVTLQQNGKCDFGRQILTFEALTLFYEPEKKAYQQKEAEVTVVIITKKGEKKLLGQFEIDIAEYANSGKENLQVRKEFGDKVKAALQFDVFIKCLGEASQTSKSVDKQSERKKQSSLSKFTSFFTGSKQSPKKEQEKEQSPDQKKKPTDKKKERQTSNPKNLAKQADKTFKNKYEVPKGKEAQKNDEKQQSKRNENTTGSERKIADKPKKKKDDSEEDDDEGTPEKPNKNLVNIKQKDNFTEVEESESDNKKLGINKKKLSTPQPQQEPIFFDQPNMAKKGNDDDEPQTRPNKMKRNENTTYTKQTVEPSQKAETKKVNQFQLGSNAEVEKLTKDVKDLKDKNMTLEKQNKELRSQNSKLADENKNLNQKLQQMSTRQNDFYKTEREKPGTGGKGDDERVRNLERQKGELLVKIQKLEEKYKKDFQKYEEKVQQYEEQKVELEEASKAQIKRLKDQFSQQKDKCDKLMAKYEQKANEAKESKQKQNDMKQRLAIAQNSLSELKLKIGDQLNQANEEGNKTVIDVLTFLSQ